MNKNVIICVKGAQNVSEQNANMLELITEGKYYKKGNTYTSGENDFYMHIREAGH